MYHLASITRAQVFNHSKRVQVGRGTCLIIKTSSYRVKNWKNESGFAFTVHELYLIFSMTCLSTTVPFFRVLSLDSINDVNKSFLSMLKTVFNSLSFSHLKQNRLFNN